MYRFAMNDLLQWKGKKNRKPLIIMGARQVGKTWLMKEFGKNCYEKTAYISFYNNQRIEVKAETNIRSQSLKAYCDKFHPEKAVRFSTLKYMDQEWMVNIPLYAVCNL